MGGRGYCEEEASGRRGGLWAVRGGGGGGYRFGGDVGLQTPRAIPPPAVYLPRHPLCFMHSQPWDPARARRPGDHLPPFSPVSHLILPTGITSLSPSTQSHISQTRRHISILTVGPTSNVCQRHRIQRPLSTHSTSQTPKKGRVAR